MKNQEVSFERFKIVTKIAIGSSHSPRIAASVSQFEPVGCLFKLA